MNDSVGIRVVVIDDGANERTIDSYRRSLGIVLDSINDKGGIQFNGHKYQMRLDNICYKNSWQKGLRFLASNFFDLIFLDIVDQSIEEIENVAEREKGYKFLKQLRSRNIDTEVIVVSGEIGTSTSPVPPETVELNRLNYNLIGFTGARFLGDVQYSAHKFHQRDSYPLFSALVCSACKRIVDKRIPHLEQERLIIPIRESQGQLQEFVGTSIKTDEIRKKIEKYALNDSTILIEGESGTGKEIVANLIHHKSMRKMVPFQAINSGAIPGTLFDTIFFGAVKGIYTDNKLDRKGLFHEANGGTLFFDDINNLDKLAQEKLLRVLEKRSVRMVGGKNEFPVNVRIMASTNEDLMKKVKEGQFREDLYYRIHVVVLSIPPLRERREDIVGLIEHFKKSFNQALAKNIVLSSDVIDHLKAYEYPGNVRELKNIIEAIIVDADVSPVNICNVERIDALKGVFSSLPDSGGALHVKITPLIPDYALL